MSMSSMSDPENLRVPASSLRLRAAAECLNCCLFRSWSSSVLLIIQPRQGHCVCVCTAGCLPQFTASFGVSEGQLTTGNWTQRKTADWRQVLSEAAPAVQSAALRRCLRWEGFVVVGLTFGFMTVVLPAAMATVTLPCELFWRRSCLR